MKVLILTLFVIFVAFTSAWSKTIAPGITLLGFILKNVESGKCVKDINPNREQFVFSVEDCASSRAETQFTLLVGREDGQQRLSSLWNQTRGSQSRIRQKCAYANTNGVENGNDNVWTAGCNGRQHCPYLQWTLKDIGDDKFIMVHPFDGWCMKPLNGILKVFEICSEADPAFQWTKI